jgi:hypothetical protein
MRIRSWPPSIQSPGIGADREFVVEVTTPIARNVVYRAYRALHTIGVQILHTRLLMRGGNAVQTLYLTEFGDAELDQGRVLEVLTVLNRACGAES